MSKKNFNEVLKEREAKNELHKEDKMTLDSTERIKVLSPGQLVFKRFINNRLAIVGSVVLIFMFVFSFLVPIFYPYSQTQIFYKYDNSVIDYAMASKRTEFSLFLLDESTDLHYSVKNNLTSTINKMSAAGEQESALTDTDGNSYLVEKMSDHVYSLLKDEREEVCFIGDETTYGTYDSIKKEIKLASGVEETEGVQSALEKAIASGKSEFKAGGETFTVTAGKKKTYTVKKSGGGITYTGSKLGADFEAALQENMDNSRFTFGDTEYVVNKASDGVHVYRLGDSTALGYLTDYVFDSYDDTFKISDEFKKNAVIAYVSKTDFEADGNGYCIVEVPDTDEIEIFDKAKDIGTPVAAFSNLVIRSYSGEDVLGFAFKEKVHEVIEDMVAQNVRTATFEWEIAQVDENGNYTLDENGNYTTETKTVTITDKNGSYVMTCEQVVYLIDIFAKPTKAHVFGTDGDGMDVLARMMYGGRVSLLVAFVVIIIETILGVIMGGIAGYFGGWIDNLIMRMVDIFYCIPSMPILIIMGAMFDAMKMKPYVRVVWLMAVLGILGWAGVARLVRGQILSLREQEFMVAAEAIGLKTRRRIFKHLVPNVMPQLIVTATSGLGSVILTESTLSFLGLGVKHPLATWGTMINSVSTAEAMKSYTYIWVPVGMLICLTVIAFNFVGDGLRDAFDPKMKR